MRLLQIFLISGALVSCATTPENPWNDLTTEVKPAATAIDCGKFPMPTEVIGDSIVYDNDGVNQLEAYRLCSEDNAAIVDAHAAQIGELKTARNDLVEAGRSQRAIADMRQEMLKDERQHHAVTSVAYWVIILGLGLSL